LGLLRKGSARLLLLLLLQLADADDMIRLFIILEGGPIALAASKQERTSCAMCVCVVDASRALSPALSVGFVFSRDEYEKLEHRLLGCAIMRSAFDHAWRRGRELFYCVRKVFFCGRQHRA
jgi:hypothetical protein